MANSRFMQLAWNISGQVDSSLRRATKEASRQFDNIGKAAGGVKNSLGGVLGGITKIGGLLTGGAFAGGGVSFSLLAQNAAALGNELNTISSQMGIGASSLSQWMYAAQKSEVSTETFKTSVAKLNKTIADAANGSESAKLAFARAGVSIHDSSGKLKSTDQLMLEMSNTFKKMPDGIYKANLAMALFGESGAGMVPLMQQGRSEIEKLNKEAGKLGFGFSDDEIATAAELQGSIDTLGFSFQGLALTVGKKLLPIINPTVKSISTWVETNREWINTRIDSAVVWFGDAIQYVRTNLPPLIRGISSVLNGINAFVKSIGGWERVLKVLAGTFLVMKGIALAGWIFNIAKAVLVLGKVFMANPIGLAIGAIVLAGWWMYSNWSSICESISGLWIKISTTAQNIWTGIKNYFIGAIHDVVKAFDSGFINGIITVFEKFHPLSIVTKAINAVFKYFTGIDMIKVGGDFISSFGDGLLQKWGQIKGSIIDAVTGWMPDWIKGGEVSMPAVSSYPVIPHANGGLITKPEIGLIGEDGAEMIIPLTKPHGPALVAQAASMMGMGSKSSSSQTERNSMLAGLNNNGGQSKVVNASQPVFAPVLNIYGVDQSSIDRVKKEMASLFDDFKRQMKEFNYQTSRIKVS